MILGDKLKVVHVSTSSRGGAGIAAFRIHSALLNNGVDSFFLSIDNDAGLEFCTRLKQPVDSFLNKVFNKIKWRLKKHFNIIIDKRESFIVQLNRIRPKLNCEIATLPFSEYDILKHPAVQNADIIHLHWVAGLLDYPTFFKNNTKPVVWTLHDMNPFQGIFHYSNDRVLNKTVSSVLDTKLQYIKEKYINKSKHKVTVVCPSQSLLKNAMKSKAFINSSGYCIANPMDMELFHSKEVKQIGKEIGIPGDNTIFLFVSHSVENNRKGFDLLLGALAKIKNKSLTLLIIGEGEAIDMHELDIRFLGTINESEKLNNYYSLAHAVIIPSREDNLPNVMLEAMACGTPVLSFNVGGMSEIIQNGFNGLKAEEVSVVSLAKIIVDFISTKDSFNPEEIRKFSFNSFSYSVIAQKYIELYKKSHN